jgi:hypothetical protein
MMFTSGHFVLLIVSDQPAARLEKISTANETRAKVLRTWSNQTRHPRFGAVSFMKRAHFLFFLV